MQFYRKSTIEMGNINKDFWTNLLEETVFYHTHPRPMAMGALVMDNDGLNSAFHRNPSDIKAQC
jgi:hypothetical protein